ncbi:hypothetical protein C8A03DRAFT_15294 [Achaetomium macrosporum]|uniref:Uncharacterized protein n=1 Tax=Achaetomium macrosporum TaxID=79813 RepID=A0AAN7CAL2_9PEZI|nr:hypothetical protein C8A03DRAFT_15294 [Achaetomium macrosporum]
MSSPAPKVDKPAPPEAAVPPSNVETSEQTTPTKRSAADDELQFVSSNPVKKRRLTAQKRVEMTQPPGTPLGSSSNQQNIARLRAPVDRCRSLATASQATRPAPGPLLESRGASLPVLENFAFPQPSVPKPTQPSPPSEAISPKQLPQALPSSLGADTRSQLVTPTPNAPSQNSVTLDQISCLDFNGVPTNTSGFELGQIFSADGGVIFGPGMGNIRSSNPAPVSPLGPAMPPFTPMNNHNAIPFTMYSTGNIVTVPQAQTATHPLVPGLPHGAHTHASHNRPSSPHPAFRAPCLHCERIRQENLLRRPHWSPGLPASANLAQRSADQGQNPHHSSLTPTGSPMCSPISAQQPGAIPRSTAAFSQPAQEQSQHQHRSPAPPATPAPPGLAPPRGLVQDIIDTVRVSFPYVQVAARHGMTLAKVAEVLSRLLMSRTTL